VSDSLQTSVARHLEGVSQECRETLSLAALLGQRFDFSMLSAASRLPDGALLDRLAEATRARLVVKTSEGEHRFRHALVRNVLYRGLTGARRAEMHASIAALLDAHWGAGVDAHAEELAYHYVRALPHGDARRALVLSVRAANTLVTRGAYARAATYYQQAIHALKHVPAEEHQGAQIHLALARAWVKLGDAARGAEAFLDAAVLANAFRMPELMGEAALGLAGLDGPADARRGLLNEARAALADVPGQAARELREALEQSLAGA
jgi:predicted ATPase